MLPGQSVGYFNIQLRFTPLLFCISGQLLTVKAFVNTLGRNEFPSASASCVDYFEYWLLWTAPESTNYTIDITSSSTYAAAAVFAPDFQCDDYTNLLLCSLGTWSTLSRTFEASVGQTFLIQIGTDNARQSITAEVSIGETIQPTPFLVDYYPCDFAALTQGKLFVSPTASSCIDCLSCQANGTFVSTINWYSSSPI